MPEQSKLYLIDKELNVRPLKASELGIQLEAGSSSGDPVHAAHGAHRIPVSHHAEGRVSVRSNVQDSFSPQDFPTAETFFSQLPEWRA